MPGRRRPFGGPRPATVANVPLSALVAGLDLKGDQQDKIIRLKQQARLKSQAAQGPPTSASDQAATDGITGVLTDSQKKALPDLLQTFSALRAAGVPLILYPDLKLTPAQNKQIAALAPSDTTASAGRAARQQAQDKVTALFTDTQKEMVEEARDEARMLGGPPPPGGRFMGQGRGGGMGANQRGGAASQALPPDGGGPGGDMAGGPPPPQDGGGGPGGPMGGPPPDGPGGPGGPPPDGGGGPGGPMGGPPPDGS